jgi:AcrR family transcriptional regulator
MRSDSSPGGQNARAARAGSGASDASPARTFVEQARRAQLVEAAVRVLAAEGWEKASLARIAREAGVSKGVINYHFDGKEELYRQLVAQIGAEAEAFMTPRIAAEPTAVGRIGAYIRANVAFLADHRDKLRALIEVILHAPAPSPYADGHARALAGLEQALAAGQASGELGAFDPVAMAVAIRGAIDAIPGRLEIDPDLDLDRLGDELAKLFERAAGTGR